MSKTDKDAEPVDAEFKDVSDSDAPRKGGGPLGGVVVFVLATLAGGALGAWGAQYLSSPGDAYDDAALRGDIAALQTRIAELESTEPAIAPDTVSALADRVAALETASPSDGADPAALTNLTDRIEALENAEPVAAGETNSALVRRLDALEDQAERAEALANQALDLPAGADSASVMSLTERVEALENAEPPAQPADLSGLEQRLAALESAPAPVVDEARIEQLEARIAAAEQAATAAGSATDETASARALAARTLALIALGEVAATDQSFEAERAALARLWSGREELAALRPIARAGVPTRAMLTESFPADAIRNAAGRETIFFGLIEVQRSGDASDGDGPQALTRLAEARLVRGDLEGAVAAVSRLEDAPAEAAQSWLLSAEARLTIEDSLDGLRAALARDAGVEE